MYGYEIFHKDLLTELINSVHNQESRQAYLFTGPDGVGRHNAARLFANALVCTNTKTAPCGTCHACIGAKNDTNPDIVYIRPTDKKTVSAEQAREIVADAYIKPFESAKKVYIIEDGSVLNEFAQNCLLKILEEPPEYVVFIIIAPSETVLLQTVLSRCTLVRFPTVKKGVMLEYIKQKYPEKADKAELLCRLSQGVPGVLDTILADPDFAILREESLKMLIPLMSSHRISAYTVCEFLENNKEKAEQIIDFWQSFLRDILMIKNKAQGIITNTDMQEQLENLAIKMPDEFPIIALEQTIRAKMMLRRYVNLHSLGLNLSFSIKNRLYKR